MKLGLYDYQRIASDDDNSRQVYVAYISWTISLGFLHNSLHSYHIRDTMHVLPITGLMLYTFLHVSGEAVITRGNLCLTVAMSDTEVCTQCAWRNKSSGNMRT
jgi:hypothetical protein